MITVSNHLTLRIAEVAWTFVHGTDPSLPVQWTQPWVVYQELFEDFGEYHLPGIHNEGVAR